MDIGIKPPFDTEWLATNWGLILPQILVSVLEKAAKIHLWESY